VYSTQVIRLLYCLVNYGYYGNGSTLQQLLKPLMNILDGCRDLPFPADPGNTFSLLSMESVFGLANQSNVLSCYHRICLCTSCLVSHTTLVPQHISMMLIFICTNHWSLWFTVWNKLVDVLPVDVDQMSLTRHNDVIIQHHPLSSHSTLDTAQTQPSRLPCYSVSSSLAVLWF